MYMDGVSVLNVHVASLIPQGRLSFTRRAVHVADVCTYCFTNGRSERDYPD